MVGGGEEGGEVEELETHLPWPVRGRSHRSHGEEGMRRRLDKGGLHSSRNSEGNVVAAAGEAGQKLQGVAGSHQVQGSKQNRLPGNHGAQAKIDVWGLGMKFRGATGQHCAKEVGDGGSVSSAAGSKKRRKTVVRGVSAGTRELVPVERQGR